MRKFLHALPSSLAKASAQNSRYYARCRCLHVPAPFNSISFLKKKENESAEKVPVPEEAENKEQQQQQQQRQLTPQEQFELAEKERLAREEHEREAIAMHEQHRALQREISSQIDLPFRLYGWLNPPDVKAGYVIERIFAEYRLPKHHILEHLYKIFCGTLYSMANNEIDEEFIREYVEANFAERIIQSAKNLREKGYVIRAGEDLSGIKGEPVGKYYHFIDLIAVRGLSATRSENMKASQYHKFKDEEDMGLVVYTPKYLTDPASFIDPAKNKTIYDPYRKMVARALVLIRTPMRLRVHDPTGAEIKIDDNMYTWEHIAIFESQLVPPPQFKSFYKQETYLEWLGKFKFGAWKLADIDNWMLGNPMVVEDDQRENYKNPIFKGSKYDPEATLDLRNV